MAMRSAHIDTGVVRARSGCAARNHGVRGGANWRVLSRTRSGGARTASSLWNVARIGANGTARPWARRRGPDCVTGNAHGNANRTSQVAPSEERSSRRIGPVSCASPQTVAVHTVTRPRTRRSESIDVFHERHTCGAMRNRSVVVSLGVISPAFQDTLENR